MVYSWFDTNSGLGETKFGDHFESGNVTYEEAVANTLSYMRTQFPRRGSYFDCPAVLKKVWDISEYAKSQKRFYGASKIDDVIRPAIGYPGKQGKEFHALEFDELNFRVDQFLAKQNQPLIQAGLSTMQMKVADEVLTKASEGARVILAELCARFGKTLWSGAVARELDADLIIVASYVKTVFASFAKDLAAFDQFSQYDHVDTSQPDYLDQIREAQKAGRRVIAYWSACPGSRRDDRIEELFKLKVDQRVLIVDEADFGIHQSKQATILVDLSQSDPDCVTLVMTGTNSDRAVTHWPIDHMVSVTYPELLIQKKTNTVYDHCHEFQHFSVNAGRDILAPDVQCFQMDLTNPVEYVIENGLVQDPDFIEGPSWAKFAAAPYKAQHFFRRVLEAMFLGKGNHPELDVAQHAWDYQPPQKQVSMMFMPANIRNDALELVGNIAQSTLPGYQVITVCGATYINGTKIKNANAEKMVKQIVEQYDHVLILSSQMAQRSFSVPEITQVFLAYDRGQDGATIQKMSRALTPGEEGKVGKIFSLSFDPNRDDKFDAMIVETAKNQAQRATETKSLREAMKDVLRTIDIFDCQPDDTIQIDVDTYLERAMARKGISRVLGKVVNFHLMTPEDVAALAAGNSAYFQNDRVDPTQHGKTRGPNVNLNDNDDEKGKKKKKSTTREEERQLAKARQMVTTILENLDIIVLGTGNSNISEAMEEILADADYRQCVREEFGVEPEVIHFLFDQGVIRQEWASLMVDQG